jgi:hypothetical protein
MLPKSYNEPGQVVVAMRFAKEIGLPAGLVALRQIAVINGTPSLWGDLPLALCYKSGKLAFIREEFGTSPKEGLTCKVTVRREGEEIDHVTTFSQFDADTAGLWGRNVWKSYPKDMLKYKARARALKDKFPDVLAGAAIAEHDFDIIPGRDDTPALVHESVNRGPKRSDLNDRLKEPPKASLEMIPEAKVVANKEGSGESIPPIEEAEIPPVLPSPEEEIEDKWEGDLPKDIGEYTIAGGFFAGRKIEEMIIDELTAFMGELRSVLERIPNHERVKEILRRTSIYTNGKI